MPTSLITGANRGIGLALCRELSARGQRVIAACRTTSPELEKLGVEVQSGVDVRTPATLDALAQRLAGTPVDWLIANAGVLRYEGLDDLNIETVKEQLEINALGTLLTVKALRPNLKRGSKIGLVTSRMGSIGDNTSGGYYGYRMSKAALNAAGMSLAHDLRPSGIAVAILHPGYVRTDMTAGSGQVESSESARMLIERMTALSLDTTGTFWHANGQQLPW
ncbi:MAG TPA: SDR family oxidoreductase [Polyangiales bacterium]|nr:SDR family oxidoreductase [Polyangiales bacterium]